MSECPSPKMMNEQIPADGKYEPGFAGFGTQNVRVEEAEIRPFVELTLVRDSTKDIAF